MLKTSSDSQFSNTIIGSPQTLEQIVPSQPKSIPSLAKMTAKSAESLSVKMHLHWGKAHTLPNKQQLHNFKQATSSRS